MKRSELHHSFLHVVQRHAFQKKIQSAVQDRSGDVPVCTQPTASKKTVSNRCVNRGLTTAINDK